MPWRVLQSGPMIETSGGINPLTKQEITTVVIAREGMVIDKDLSAPLKERYEDQDPYVRSLVEYGEFEYETVKDEDTGEDVQRPVFVPRGIQSDGGDAPQTDEALVTANVDLQARVSELEDQSAQKDNQIAELEQKVSDAEAAGTEHSGQVDALQQRVTELEGQLEEAQKALDEATAPAAEGDEEASTG